jgi:hypothetical protein
MNKDLEQFENELKRLVPRRLSSATRRKLQARLRRRHTLIRWPRPTLAAAAAVLLAVTASLWFLPGHKRGEQTAQEPPPPEEPRRPTPIIIPEEELLAPVSFGTVLLDEQDEGTVFIPDYGPARRVRYRLINNVQWQSTNEDVRFTVTRPSEKVILIPVNTH